MTPDSRKLRDALKIATNGHESLVELMKKIGPSQTDGPGLIPTLGAQPWAQQLLERWKDLNELPKVTRNAIANLRRGR